MRPLLALFARSMREQTRHKLTPFARAGIVLAILLMMSSYQSTYRFRYGAPGREFFQMVVAVNIFFIVVATLSTFASAITEEKEEDTLGLLRMTRLNPLSILLGKSTSRLCGVLLLLVAQFPFTLLAVAMGGVSIRQIVATYVVLGSSMFFLCSLALLFSVVCRRSVRSTAFTLGVGFVLYALMPIGYAVAESRRQSGRSGNYEPGWFEVLAEQFLEANPVYRIYQEVMDSKFTGSIFEIQFWSHMIGGVLLFLLAWRLFEHFCREALETSPPKIKDAKGQLRPRRFHVGRPARNALAWKDFHFLYNGRKGFAIRYVIYTLLIGVVLALWRYNGEPIRQRETGVFLMIWALVSAGAEICIVAVTMFGAELKQQTLSSLITLPLNTGQIIWQKLRGAVGALTPNATIFLVGAVLNPYGLLSAFRDVGRMRYYEGVIFAYYVIEGLLFLALLVNFSLRFRRAAIPAAILVMFLLNFLLGMLAVFLTRGMRGDTEGLALAGVALFVLFLALTVRDVFRLVPRLAAAE